MLPLASTEPFAKGSNRHVYVHPHNPDLCVKIPARGKDRRCRKAQRRELRDWAWLQRWGRNEWFERIPAIEGVVDTDMGSGIVSTLYRDEDGRIARNLSQLVCERKELTPSLMQAVEELMAWLRQHRLPTWDMGPHNTVAVGSGNEQWKLFIVEGWVHRRCHRFPWWVHLAGDRMADRQIQKFTRRMANLTAHAARLPHEG